MGIRLLFSASAISRTQIGRQWEIIQELERDGHNSNLARKALATPLQTQKAHLDHRDQLVKMLEGSPEPISPEGA